MKKLFFVIWISLSVYHLQAQMAFGIPVDFYSLNNAIYNPGIHDDYYSNMWVTDRSNEELSGPEKAFLDGSFEDNHPGHIILGEATVTYNCHGYTFGVIQGTDRYNISWRADLCNGAFIHRRLRRLELVTIFADETTNKENTATFKKSCYYEEACFHPHYPSRMLPLLRPGEKTTHL